MNWLDFESRSVRWITGSGALFGVAALVLGHVLLSPDYEVLYSGGMNAVHCRDIQGRQTCVFVYEFSIGNTGKRVQDGLRVEWALDLRPWVSGLRVADIIASAKKTRQPRIQMSYAGGTTVYAIDNLMPNTVVDFEWRCLACTPAQLQAMQQARANVVARGTLSEGDPRVSTLRRGATNLLRIFGLFG